MSVQAYTGATRLLIKVQREDRYGVWILILGEMGVGEVRGGQWS